MGFTPPQFYGVSADAQGVTVEWSSSLKGGALPTSAAVVLPVSVQVTGTARMEVRIPAWLYRTVAAALLI